MPTKVTRLEGSRLLGISPSDGQFGWRDYLASIGLSTLAQKQSIISKQLDY